MALVIHCADIGSVKTGNFGWARLATEEAGAACITGHDIRLFASGIAADLNAGHRVAVGFECPLFVPVPDAPRSADLGPPRRT